MYLRIEWGNWCQRRGGGGMGSWGSGRRGSIEKFSGFSRLRNTVRVFRKTGND